MLRLQGVRKQYGGRGDVLTGIDLEVAAGIPVAVVGANGTGKSTLLRIVAGASSPSAGVVSGRPPVVGYVPAQFPASSRMPVQAYLQHMAALHGAPGADPAPVLDELGYTGSRTAPVTHLSTGNAQKIGLAQALTCGATLLVLDEPLPIRLLTRRALVLAALTVFLLMGAVGTVYYLITTYLQDALGLTPLQAGLGFLPLSILSMVGAGRLFPLFAARFGVERTLVIGMAGIGVALLVLTAGMAGRSYWTLLPGLVWALFAGIAFPAVFRAAGAAVDAAEQGVAAALVSTAQYVGGAVGLAALVGISGLDRAAGTSALVGALQVVGWAAAALALAGAATAWALRSRRR